MTVVSKDKYQNKIKIKIKNEHNVVYNTDDRRPTFVRMFYGGYDPRDQY